MKKYLHFKQIKTLNLNINKASFNLKVIYNNRQRVSKKIIKLFKNIDVNKSKLKEKTMLEIFNEKYFLN